MGSETILVPLVDERQRIDSGIQALKDKMAILHKRREVIQAAIDVMRSSDDEVDALLEQAHKKPVNVAARVYNVDEAALEIAVLAALQAHGALGKDRLERLLETEQVLFSKAGLNRVLQTSPKIVRSGERQMTRYSVSE